MLNVQQAAAQYQVRAASIRRWIRDGDLSATKVGRSYLIAERDMRRALAMPRRRGRPSELQRTRRANWFHRISFPRDAVAGLGFAGETWRTDVELPGYADLVAASSRFKWRLSTWDLTSRLLPDVAEAAAAVEYSVEKIHRAIAVVEAYYVPYLPALLEGPEPQYGRGASHPAVADAYSEYANLLWWIRALSDRLEHRYAGKTYGLLPALAPGRLDDRARGLASALSRDLAIEARHLANYSLHHSTIPYAFNSSAQVVNGRLELPIPDRVSAPVENSWDLTYSSGRTLSTYADEAASIVDKFMADLLDAFEEELPTRMKRSS